MWPVILVMDTLLIPGLATGECKGVWSPPPPGHCHHSRRTIGLAHNFHGAEWLVATTRPPRM